MEDLLEEPVLKVMDRIAAQGPTARVILENLLRDMFRGEDRPEEEARLRRRFRLGASRIAYPAALASAN